MQTSDAASCENSELCVYHIKWVTWNSVKTPLITQNVNGPCPLLAIFNVLLLSRRVTLPETLEMISSKQMIDYIGGLIFESMPEHLDDGEKLNYEQNMSDAMTIIPKLQTGIDVNIQFTSVSSFECTPELAVFDLLQIPLYHGWLPDPQDSKTCSCVSNCSYNQLVEKIIVNKESSDENLQREGLVAEEFLTNTASQLTCHGVVNILETTPNHRVAVLFRNNHFLTLYKKENELFTLVTDQGFLMKPNIVWETLSSVQGDTSFTDANFSTTPTLNQPTEQLDIDFQMALSLQNETSTHVDGNLSVEEQDRQLASKIQRQFDQESLQYPRSSAPPTDNPTPANQPKGEKCVIL
nr:ubiquitin carboxyl-terminal hydrolase MINDY-2 [Ciona intestinalis]|eukprot:XP_002126602.3 ubiquitin carboxyl-terminal hydrolase MINDY-2 [Ciona intestinalis]